MKAIPRRQSVALRKDQRTEYRDVFARVSHIGSRRIGRAFLYASLYTTLSLGGGIALWSIGAPILSNRFVPGPLPVFKAAVHLWTHGVLVADAVASLERVALGFTIGTMLAVPVGFAMGWYEWIRRLVEPWVQFFRSVPALAFIPLVVIIFGIGQTPKVLVITLASFLSVVIASFQGVRDVDKTLIEAARVLGAKDWAIFRRVAVPAALPYIFVGARIGLGNSWGTLVAAELIASSSGLGYLTQHASLYFNIPDVIVAIIAIGVLGLMMDRVIVVAGSRLTSWQERR